MNRCAVACGCLALVQATFAGSATWNYREGVGGSPANPTLWTDTANWTGGAPASGETAIATFPDAGMSTNLVWVKLPDDALVTLGGIVHSGTSSAKYRFIGGQGFHFFADKDNRAQLKADASNWDIIYSPTRVKYSLDLRGVSLACPLTFDRTNDLQLYFYSPNACYLGNLYAPCGGETRAYIPDLKYLRVGHYDNFESPNNSDAHTGAWVATAGSKRLKWVSGKKGTELAVGQYVHAAGVVPEGAYVERIYTDDYVELSAPALASSADAIAGTSISFDRCYYKLTQHLKQLIMYGNQAIFEFGNRKTVENEMTLDIDEWVGTDPNWGIMLAFTGHAYWSESEEAIDSYPQPSLVLLPDMSGVNSYLGARSGHVRFTSTEPGGADLKQLKFYESANYRQYGRLVLETPAGISSTVACSNEWFGTIGKKGLGEMTIKTTLAGHYRLRVYEAFHA